MKEWNIDLIYGLKLDEKSKCIFVVINSAKVKMIYIIRYIYKTNWYVCFKVAICRILIKSITFQVTLELYQVDVI